MFDFIINNYNAFIIGGVVLLLGLFGYMLDRKKYEKYRDEILNESGASTIMNSTPNRGFSSEPTLVNNSEVPEAEAAGVAEAVSNIPEVNLENDNTVVLEPSAPNTISLEQTQSTDTNANV